MIAWLLLAWITGSLPIGLFVGAFMRAGSGPAAPHLREGWVEP